MEFRQYLERIRKVNGEKYLTKTVDLYVSIIEKHEPELQKRKDNVQDLIEYMNSAIKDTRNPYIKASFKLYLGFLGVDEEDDRLNLLKKTKKRASAVNSLRMLGEKSIPEKDMKILLDAVEPEWRLILKVLYETAIRENEFLNICWKDINVNEDPSSPIGAEVRILGKGGKMRTVFLTKETTLSILDKRMEAEEESDRVFIFTMGDGKLFKRQDKALYDGIKKRTKEHLGRPYSVHSIRHSALQRLSDQGADIMGVSALAGHSNLQTTQIYVKASKVMAKNTFEKSLEAQNADS